MDRTSSDALLEFADRLLEVYGAAPPYDIMNYLAETYRRMARELDPTEEYFASDSRFMTLDELFRSFPPGRICDLGCGHGLMLTRLSARHQVCGTEYDAGLVEHCRSRGLNVVQADLNQDEVLPFGEVLFDAILLSEVCEHLLNPRNAIRLARRSLRVGGMLVVTVPNAIPLFVRWSVLFGRSIDWLHYPSPDTERTGHLRFYTLESMGRLLREEQFDIVDTRGVSFRFNGRFWQRFCYWTSRCVFARSSSGPTRVDRWLGSVFPGLSPGLLFLAKA